MKWNEVTWYSRILAIILFIAVIPALAFYIGTRYQETADIINNTPALNSDTVKVSNLPVTQSEEATSSTSSVTVK